MSKDFFSREINVMRNASNTAVYTGSNTVILRTALEEIGGFPYDTVTEDFETSLRLQKAGYITYATTEVLAAGLSTTTVESMIGQRIRWARGVIQSIQNTNPVFAKELPAAARLSYLNSYLYWWSFLCRMIFILAPVLFALFGFRLVECGFGELLLFWLPSYVCSPCIYGVSEHQYPESALEPDYRYHPCPLSDYPGFSGIGGDSPEEIQSNR